MLLAMGSIKGVSADKGVGSIKGAFAAIVIVVAPIIIVIWVRVGGRSLDDL